MSGGEAANPAVDRARGWHVAVGEVVTERAVPPEHQRWISDLYDACTWSGDHWIGRVLLLGWSWSLIYHLLNGIRHLVMDAGAAFELKRNKMFSMVVIVGGVVLTAAFWLYLGMK